MHRLRTDIPMQGNGKHTHMVRFNSCIRPAASTTPVHTSKKNRLICSIDNKFLHLSWWSLTTFCEKTWTPAELDLHTRSLRELGTHPSGTLHTPIFLYLLFTVTNMFKEFLHLI